jgi:hypothetical protein
MKWTGASERTAKNWLTGARGPTGKHLVSLVHHSDAVLEMLLQLAGRQASLVSVNLAYARSKLARVAAQPNSSAACRFSAVPAVP